VLGKLKSFFAAPPKPVTIDAVFHPRFQEPFHLGAVPQEGGAVSFGATGSAPWFNPRSEHDRRILMSTPTHLLETDDPQVLSKIGDAQFAPHHEFVLYQPWREPAGEGHVRMLGALTEAMAPAIGAALAGSPVKHFFLITGGVFPGALTALKNSLQGHRLETLGLFWYYSGDDMTDDPRVVDDLVSLCQASKTERLSLLTAAVDSVAEDRLVKGLAQAPLLKECSVWEKDDHARYPRFRTPTLDALLRARNPSETV
jgi:hypothetical protein